MALKRVIVPSASGSITQETFNSLAATWISTRLGYGEGKVPVIKDGVLQFVDAPEQITNNKFPYTLPLILS